jgi:hypothetical protein
MFEDFFYPALIMNSYLIILALVSIAVVASSKVSSSSGLISSLRREASLKPKKALFIHAQSHDNTHEPHLPHVPEATSPDVYDKALGLRAGSSSLLQLQMESLPVLKLALQAILTLIGVTSWLIPLFSPNLHSNSNLLSYGNAFAGGIFLMLGLGHLIPSSLQSLSEHGYPPAYTFYFVLLGYSIILFIEKIAFNTHEIMHHHAEENQKGERMTYRISCCMCHSLTAFTLSCLRRGYWSKLCDRIDFGFIYPQVHV